MIAFKNFLKQSLLLEHTDVDFLQFHNKSMQTWFSSYTKDINKITHILADYLKILWENYIYEVLEESIIDEINGKSINISDKIQTKLDSSLTDYDVLAELNSLGNGYVIYIKHDLELPEHPIQLLKEVFLTTINNELRKLPYLKVFNEDFTQGHDLDLGDEQYHTFNISLGSEEDFYNERTLFSNLFIMKLSEINGKPLSLYKNISISFSDKPTTYYDKSEYIVIDFGFLGPAHVVLHDKNKRERIEKRLNHELGLQISKIKNNSFYLTSI